MNRLTNIETEPNLNKIQYGMNSTFREKERKKNSDVLRIPNPQVISK